MTFKGLDTEFIDLIYFQDSQSKEDFIQTALSVFNSMGINYNTSPDEYLNKIVQFEEDNPDKEIDFLREIVDFGEPLGLKKVKEYYKGLSFVVTNIIRKQQSDFKDFDFEESLLSELISENQNYNYARIDTLTFIGLTHAEAGNIQAAQNYFSRIENEVGLYTISPITVSDFIKAIADWYLSKHDTQNAKKYYNLALSINPKCPVKCIS